MLKLIATIFTVGLLMGNSRAANIQPYIVNGESVGVVGKDSSGQEIIENIGEFPYMVSLDEKGFHVCGGVIVSENMVITADHCVHGADPSIFQVRAGTLSIWRGQEPTEQILDVESITSHPQFRPSDNLNDIAILWLKGQFAFNQHVNKVKMSELTGESYVNRKLTTIGWGSDKKTSRTATLKKALLDVIDPTHCREMLWQWSVPETMICVGDKQDRQTTCSGDSGGPLLQHNPQNNKEDIFVGIKSGGLCDPVMPTLFADVGKLRSWVLDEMRKKKLGC